MIDYQLFPRRLPWPDARVITQVSLLLANFTGYTCDVALNSSGTFSHAAFDNATSVLVHSSQYESIAAE